MNNSSVADVHVGPGRRRGGGKLNPRAFKARSVSARSERGDERRGATVKRAVSARRNEDRRRIYSCTLRLNYSCATRIIARVNRGCPIIERIVSRPTKKVKEKRTERGEKGRLESIAHRLTKRMDRRRLRTGRAGIKYYSRISVLTPLLRVVSPTCHFRRETMGDDTRMVENIRSRRLSIFLSEKFPFAIIAATY